MDIYLWHRSPYENTKIKFVSEIYVFQLDWNDWFWSRRCNLWFEGRITKREKRIILSLRTTPDKHVILDHWSSEIEKIPVLSRKPTGTQCTCNWSFDVLVRLIWFAEDSRSGYPLPTFPNSYTFDLSFKESITWKYCRY